MASRPSAGEEDEKRDNNSTFTSFSFPEANDYFSLMLRQADSSILHHNKPRVHEMAHRFGKEGANPEALFRVG
jgi:hypothetical protein